MFPASCPRLAHQRRNLDRFRIRRAEHVRAQLLPCRPQILARGEPRKPNGAPLLFLSSLGTAAAAHRSCPPETAMERGRRYLRDRRRCVHVLAACLTGGSRRIRSGPKRACATATGSTRTRHVIKTRGRVRSPSAWNLPYIQNKMILSCNM